MLWEALACTSWEVSWLLVIMLDERVEQARNRLQESLWPPSNAPGTLHAEAFDTKHLQVAFGEVLSVGREVDPTSKCA